MNIRLDLRLDRRHLRAIPPIVATLLALAFIQWWVVPLAPVLVVVAWLVTGMLIASIDELVTWWRARRYELALVRSIDLHPSRLEPPKHAKPSRWHRRPAVA